MNEQDVIERRKTRKINGFIQYFRRQQLFIIYIFLFFVIIDIVTLSLY